MKRLYLLLGLLICTVAYAASTTTNYSLYKPAVGDTNWGALVNTNFDTIDSTMKTNEDAIAVNTAKVTNATHTGDVTGSGALTIANDVVADAEINWDSVQEITDDNINWIDFPGFTEDYVLTATTDGVNWEVASGSSISGTDTQVLFFDGDNSPAGDAGMTYNKTTDTLTVGSVATTAAGQTVIDEGLVVNNDGGATETHDFVVNTDTVASAFECDAGDDTCTYQVPIYIKEQADANADVAGLGQLWVNTATPNELYFTDDAGTDFQLGVGSAETNSLETTITGIADTEIFVGDGADSGAFVVVGGDASLANTGALTVDWTQLAEGELSTGVVVSDDIKDATIVTGDIAADTITHANIADADQADTKCIWFEDPTADDDFNSIWANKTANDFLITEIWCESDQTIDFDLQVDDGSPADVNGTDIQCAAGEADDTSLGGDTTVAAGEELDLAVTSVANTPTWVSICFTGNWVD